MTHYQSIESQFIPPGVVTDIETFKEFVRDELDNMMKSKKEYQEKINDEVPLPIVMYVLYKDLTMNKSVLFPRSAMEKKAMILAIKKRIFNPGKMHGKQLCTEPIYGAFCSEVFMASYQMSNEEREKMDKLGGDGEMNEEQMQEAIKRFKRSGDSEKVTRVFMQFEDAVTHEYDVRVFQIIDPCILVDDDKSSEMLTKVFNERKKSFLERSASDVDGIMNSMFDYTEEQEFNALGEVNHSMDYYDLGEAVKYIQDLLKNQPGVDTSK